ncbi:STAS domain-containing protein [Micromonospora sp. NPDC005298]|uniref:STAS domain-containing protein n=1 Tax=Micromonospora sp. NPDC005298 TaxID=3156873 RepID=UPI0033A28896
MTGPLTPVRCTLPLVKVSVSELDLACLPEAGTVFDRLLALQPRQVVLDLSACRHIDAAAVGLLLDLHRRLSRADAVLTLANPNPRIRRILKITHLDRVLSIVTDRPPPRPAVGTPGPAPVPTRPGGAYGRASVTVGPRRTADTVDRDEP